MSGPDSLGLERLRKRLRRVIRPAWPAALRRTKPVSQSWGFDRGTPIDRFFIERFLDAHRTDIRGEVVEIKDSGYTHRFGTAVTRAHVLDIDPANPEATIIADLSAADAVPADRFDCFLLTQTLQFIFDVRLAIFHVHRMLRSGGVLLVTLPVVSRIAPRYGLETEYWRFTTASCRRLFADAFGPDRVTVSAVGNLLACIAFLSGVAIEEVPRRKLRSNDPHFPLLICVRCVKA
jgi:hypothetical protein